MGKLLPVIEIAAVICFVWFLVAQVGLPAIDGDKLFPSFRKKRRHLGVARQQAVSDLTEAEIKAETQKLVREAEAVARRAQMRSTEGENS